MVALLTAAAQIWASQFYMCLLFINYNKMFFFVYYEELCYFFIILFHDLLALTQFLIYS